MTKIIKCECKHDWQDDKYGQWNRIHNEAKPKSGTGKAWVCTVCGKRRDE